MNPQTLEDIYELTPLQQGMLFHTLYSLPQECMYLEQFSTPIVGNIEVDAFIGAWQALVDRHTILRTSFHWEDISKPLQIVYRNAVIEVNIQDWRDSAAAELDTRLDAFLKNDRVRGFALSDPPLLRLALLRTDIAAYQLVLTFHHAILDGWSKGILYREFVALYDAARHGHEVALPAPRPYREYIAWLQAQNFASAEAFWKRTLAGFDTPTHLELAPPSYTPTPTQAFATTQRRLPSRTTAALSALARQLQITLNTVVEGAWAYILSCYSGTDDVVFGAVVSGRPPNLPGIEAMIGLFINTLPVRVRVTTNEPATEFLRRLQSERAEAFQFEFTPLLQVQEWSEILRGTSLFETLFVFENYPSFSGPDDGIELPADLPAPRAFERTNYPLTVLVSPHSMLSVEIVYATDRFSAEAMEQFIDHFLQILDQLAYKPGAPITSIALITPSERQALLYDWNATEAVYERAEVHRLFELQASVMPERIAITGEQSELTYGELDRRANQLAHRLRDLGVTTDVPVAVCLPRGADLAVSVLGVLKAGGVYLPLDPTYPRERLSLMVQDANVGAFVTQASLLEVLPKIKLTCIQVDAEATSIAHLPTEKPLLSVDGESLAYILYTSGSTGRPKGVAMPHGAMCNLIAWQLSAFHQPAAARTLQFASISFDVSFQEMLSTWAAGGTLVAISEPARQDPEELLQFLLTQRVERVFLPVVALQQLAELGPAPRDLSLREIITAGEQLRITPEIVRFVKSLRELDLCNQYGPTETHVITAYTLRGDPDTWPVLPPIGRPIYNTRIYLLDQHRRPVPIGVVGNLWVAGANLARGYLGSAELGTEQFRPDPFSNLPNARIYRTGDLARYRSDGVLEFLGRRDQQIKIRGFRVELGEIESVLSGHSGVAAAVAVAREDRVGDRRIVAYVLAADGAPLSVEMLREICAEKLPGYMVPQTFMILDAFPLTRSGKVDRRALPAPSTERGDLQAPFLAPRNATEKILVGIWSDVLGIECVGVCDDFFALGGHSLLSVQLVSRIRSAFDVDLPIRSPFDHRTIAEMAVYLEQLLLAEVEGLSEAEVENLAQTSGALARQRGKP